MERQTFCEHWRPIQKLFTTNTDTLKFEECSIVKELRAENKQLRACIANGDNILKSANNDVKRLSQYADKLEAENKRLKEALDDMLYQFAFDRGGKWTTGGLSALEYAFDVMGWEDPHPMPKELLCDEPGCKERSTCGTPIPNDYRRTCGKHRPPFGGE